MAFKVHFRSSKELKDIKIKYEEYQSDINIDYWAGDIGAAPFIYVHSYDDDKKGGLILDLHFIISMKLYNNKFFPYLDIKFRDPTNFMADKLHPTDKTILSFFKRVNSDILMPIRLDFVITNYRMIKSQDDTNDRIYMIRAILFFNDITDTIGLKGTSFKVMKYLAKTAELGFASNIDNTDDEMVWINPGDYISEFIPDIVKYSYRSDKSFLWAFIDLYYNLNYIDIEEQLSQNTMDQKSVMSTPIITVDKKTRVSNLIFSNHPNMKGSNLHIKKYNMENSARDVNWNIGYDAQIYYYDSIDNNAIDNQLDTISNPQRKTDKISLKSFDKLTNTRRYYMGIMDTDNVHKNFLYARKQNENNIKFLQKLKINIILDIPNMSVYRFQHVELVIYEIDTFANDYASKNIAKTDSYRVNEKLSGDWLITGINFIYDSEQTQQEITLVKRELNKTYDKERLDALTKNFYKVGQK